MSAAAFSSCANLSAFRAAMTALSAGKPEIGGHSIKDPEISFMNNVHGVNVGSGFFQGGGFRIDRENDLIEFIYNAPEEN